MIPHYVQGKSAARIVDEAKRNFAKNAHIDYYREYAQQLEMLLLVAVKDALCNCNGMQGTYVNYVEGVEGRAIAFLNMVLPKEKQQCVRCDPRDKYEGWDSDSGK